MPRLVRSSLLIVLLLAMLAGCGAKPGASPTAAPSPIPATPAAEAVPAYPGPEVVATPAGYPGPQIETPMPTRTPVNTQGTPRKGLGNVQGIILTRAPGTDQAAPLQNTTLYLATMLNNVDGKPSGIVRVNEDNAPLAVTDLEGDFIFVNIEPGWYGLVIKHPLSLLMATDVITGDDIVFELKSGDKLDLGKITATIGS